jgi:AbrB family looped-hinge helix DNA binding protein
MEIHFTTLSSKGQIVIPAVLRQKLGIKEGTRLAIQSKANHLILQPLTNAFIDGVRGSCKGQTSLVKAREREHRIEKDRLAHE